MKLKHVSAALLIATALLMIVALPLPAFGENGARSEDLVVKYYADVEAAYAALKACDVDIVGYEITTDLYLDAITDPNICLGPVGDRGMYEVDINSNATIPDLPGIEAPTHGIRNWRFRKAMTHLVDKTKVVQVHCAGFADRIDQPISYMHKGWRNTSCWYEDGTGVNYDPVLAAAEFDANGNTQGTTTNPDYNAVHPGSAQFIRVYPSDHPQKAGLDLDPVKVCIRTDDVRRMEAGRDLADELRLAGIPVNQVEGPSTVLYPIVMDDRNYHAYTGGWSLGRFPALTIYDLYSGQFFYESGPNYVTGCLPTGDDIDDIAAEFGPYHDPRNIDPTWQAVVGGDCSNETRNYPLLDYYFYGARFPDSYAEAQDFARLALGYGWCEMYVTIPLFSARSFWAWKCDVKGVVNGEGTGPENGYTFVNAYKPGGGALVYGTKTAPLAMNIIYSSWYYDYQNLDRMNLAGGMDTPPYDNSVDQVGYMSDWTVDTWVDPDDSVEKSLITQCYRTDAYFRKPVTGDQGEQVTNEHIYASTWYYYQQPLAWLNPSVMDIKTLRMINCDHIKPGQTGIEIYWNLGGYWNVYQGSTYILSFDWFALGGLSVTTTETLTSDADGYLFTTDPVFWVESASQGGTPLTVGVDFDIYMSKTGHTNEADVRIINPAHQELPILITYLAVGDATGYTPGNIAWEDSFEGAGMFYAIDFLPDTGGFLVLKKNPTYPMELPPLGEIDFIKKSNGCYKIDIFDVVIAASAYGSQGGAVPSPNWFAGADLAPECCVIDIFDIVTITGKYGIQFDCDP